MDANSDEDRPMPKTQIVSPKIRQSSGHFSRATVAEARGRLSPDYLIEMNAIAVIGD
jgi:hypothetical protein